MSIYVKVGDETIVVTGANGSGIQAGRHHATPIPFEALRIAVTTSLARQVEGKVVEPPRSGSFVKRKPRVVVRAIRWDGGNWLEVEEWFAEVVRHWDRPHDEASVVVSESGCIRYEDKNGAVECPVGSWLVWNGGSTRPFAVIDAQFRRLYAASGELVDPFAATSALESLARVHGELARWRAWAADLLKTVAVTDDDERTRRKISAVLEAPSVIELDGGKSEDTRPSYDRLSAVAEQSPFVAAAVRAHVDEAAPENDFVVETCARVGHEVYRVALGDPCMPEWVEALEHDRAVARESVRGTLDGVPPARWFEKWRDEMLADGWKLGSPRDSTLKVHPNLAASYEDLAPEQRAADQLFVTAVLATARALGDLVDAYQAPVFKVSGDLSSEAFADFKDRLAATPLVTSWNMPIVDDEVALVRRPASSYTRAGMVSFLDQEIDSALRPSGARVCDRLSTEATVLSFLVVRSFVVAGVSDRDLTSGAFERFVDAREEDRVVLLYEFVEQRRADHPIPRPADQVKDWLAARAHVDERLVALFARHCECRPVNTARTSHSHDCDTGITDDIRVAIHRVIVAGPDEDTDWGQPRAATDDEVRGARARIMADAIWEGTTADLRRESMEPPDAKGGAS